MYTYIYKFDLFVNECFMWFQKNSYIFQISNCILKGQKKFDRQNQRCYGPIQIVTCVTCIASGFYHLWPINYCVGKYFAWCTNRTLLWYCTLLQSVGKRQTVSYESGTKNPSLIDNNNYYYNKLVIFVKLCDLRFVLKTELPYFFLFRGKIVYENYQTIQN